MAVEKVILRGIYYGAERIPDRWFDFIPGSFFKEKDREGKKKERGRDDRRLRHRSSNRNREDREQDIDRQNPRSERGRRHGRRGSPYDDEDNDEEGYDDDDYYGSEDEGRGRCKARGEYRRWNEDFFVRDTPYPGRTYREHFQGHRRRGLSSGGRDAGHVPNRSKTSLQRPMSSTKPQAAQRRKATGINMSDGYVPFSHMDNGRSEEGPQYDASARMLPRYTPHGPSRDEAYSHHRPGPASHRQPPSSQQAGFTSAQMPTAVSFDKSRFTRPNQRSGDGGYVSESYRRDEWYPRDSDGSRHRDTNRSNRYTFRYDD